MLVALVSGMVAHQRGGWLELHPDQRAGGKFSIS